MKKTFTQGTIIEDIRSEKYKGVRCKGVVITARCDIANQKVYNIHYLSALEMKDWLKEVLVPEILKEKRDDVLSSIKQFAKTYRLDYKTLIDMGYDTALQVMESTATKAKEKQKAAEWVNEWKQQDELISRSLDDKEKQEILKKYGSKKLIKKLTPIYNYNYAKYCFIPKCAYAEEGSMTDGLVVDLQDICQMSMNTAQEIKEYKYDYELITDEDKRKEINERFFFEDQADFVIMDNVIESPWNERLLQEFSFMFARIGLDNADAEQIEEYCKEIVGECECDT